MIHKAWVLWNMTKALWKERPPTETRCATGVRLIIALVASTLSAPCSRCRATICSGQSSLTLQRRESSQTPANPCPVPYTWEEEAWHCSLRRTVSTHYQQVSLDCSTSYVNFYHLPFFCRKKRQCNVSEHLLLSELHVCKTKLALKPLNYP